MNCEQGGRVGMNDLSKDQAVSAKDWERWRNCHVRPNV